MSRKKTGMSMLMMPAMIWATDRKTLVMLTANPVCSNSVLNMMPSDSPQLTMQKQLKAMTKNSSTVRGSPTAKTARTAKIRLVTASNGTSMVVYCMKNASTLYAPSSCSREKTSRSSG